MRKFSCEKMVEGIRVEFGRSRLLCSPCQEGVLHYRIRSQRGKKVASCKMQTRIGFSVSLPMAVLMKDFTLIMRLKFLHLSSM